MSRYIFKKNSESHFAVVKNPVIIETPKETKKFNLRLSNGDIDFIKFLSEKNGTSKNQIIDNLVEAVIKDFLSSLETEEYILLIKIADSLNGVDTWNNMDLSWISNLYPSRIPEDQIHNDLYNQYAIDNLKDRSETYKHMFTALASSKLSNDFNSKQLDGKSNETEK